MSTLEDYRRVQATLMTEAQLLATVRAMAGAYGWDTYHTHRSDRSEPGWPDLVLARGGQVLFRELKTTRGRLSGPQQRWLDALTATGLDAGVWRPGELLDGSIEAALRPQRPTLAIRIEEAVDVLAGRLYVLGYGLRGFIPDAPWPHADPELRRLLLAEARRVLAGMAPHLGLPPLELGPDE